MYRIHVLRFVIHVLCVSARNQCIEKSWYMYYSVNTRIWVVIRVLYNKYVYLFVIHVLHCITSNTCIMATHHSTPICLYFAADRLALFSGCVVSASCCWGFAARLPPRPFPRPAWLASRPFPRPALMRGCSSSSESRICCRSGSTPSRWNALYAASCLSGESLSIPCICSLARSQIRWSELSLELSNVKFEREC